MTRRLFTTTSLVGLVILLLKVFPSTGLMAGIENREKSVKNDDEPTPVFAPRVTGPAPANEATIVTLNNGELRIFYINRPGEANRLMSVRSADGINWQAPEVELELTPSRNPGFGVNYLRMKVLSNDRKNESGISIKEFSYNQIP